MKHNKIKDFVLKMEKAGLPEIAITTFKHYYNQVFEGQRGLISSEDILPLKPNQINKFADLVSYKNAGQKVLQATVMILLNGGLGTSMGLYGPKSLLKVKNNQTFLDIIIRQAHLSGVKLVLMNSFNTDTAINKALDSMFAPDDPRRPLTFNQHKFPKIQQHNFGPAFWDSNPKLEWNPPGHGDIYLALHTSGMLTKLLQSGFRYAFISNADNLGAILDPGLLGYFSEKNFPFMMEVALKTPADLKGGHLARTRNNRLILREVAQCPSEELDDFKTIERYPFFNTNNLWIRLEFLQDLINKDGWVRLPLILNPKTLDPRASQSPPVYQVETAMGAAISLFDGATAVQVPRHRFIPVKKSNELLDIRSDRYFLRDQAFLELNPFCKLPKPEIDLDPRFFAHIDQFEARLKDIPSLVECESLQVKGDISFGPDVHIKGRVSIKNSGASQLEIHAGTIFEKK